MTDREPRQRTLTGGTPGRGFAGASFQHAPDAMSMPLPKLKLGGGALMASSSSSSSASSSSGSSSESEGDVVNLDEEDDEFIF